MEPRIDLLTLQMNLPYYNLKEKLGRKVEINWRAEWERFDAKKLFDFNLAQIPESELESMRKRQDVLMDGNQAAISILTRLVDGLCGYPITPSTPIAETFARAASQGQKNIFGHELMYFQPSDELSAIASVEAMACQGGPLCRQHFVPGPVAEDEKPLFGGGQTVAGDHDRDGSGSEQRLIKHSRRPY